MSPPVQGPEHKDIAVIKMDVKPEPSYPQAIVLDLSPVNFLDTVGIRALQNVRTWKARAIISLVTFTL